MWSRWERPEYELASPLGEDSFGNIVDLNFSSSNSPHLLIGGTTGSGKSEALNTILDGMVRYYSEHELRLMLVDPKGTELQHYEDSKHLEGTIGWDDSDAVSLLEQAVVEMQERYAKLKSKRTRSLPEYNKKVSDAERIPWWVVVLDEYADLTSDKDSKKVIEGYLKRLAQKARAAGIHVIIATQKPSAEVISTNLRSNLPTQLALRVKSSTESRVIIDEAGAETLNGKGDALLKAEGKLTRIQCAKA
nr:FtsK/SpoIIIE domain-containing protein [Vibrio natriegens]